MQQLIMYHCNGDSKHDQDFTMTSLDLINYLYRVILYIKISDILLLLGCDITQSHVLF